MNQTEPELIMDNEQRQDDNLGGDRRKVDRRKKQIDFEGEDRRKSQRRSGNDRRSSKLL